MHRAKNRRPTNSIGESLGKNRSIASAVIAATAGIAATGGSALACFNELNSAPCQCAAKFNLVPSAVALTHGQPAGDPIGGGSLGGGSLGGGSLGGGSLNGSPVTLVHVFNFDFSTNPAGMPVMDATIHAGDTIQWHWDSGVHNVRTLEGGTLSFNSGYLSPAATFDFTFTQPGVYAYYCDLHGFDNGDGTASGMAGTITVLANNVSSAWNVDADGSWQTASNWTGSAIPNGPGHTATFGPVVSEARNVTVDAPVTVGSIVFDATPPSGYGIFGTSTLTLQGADASAPANVTMVTGNDVIGAPLAVASDTTFDITSSNSLLTITNLQETTKSLTKAGPGGLLVNNIRAAALTVDAGVVFVSGNGGDSGTSRIGTLSFAGGTTPTATLDLNDNDLILTTTPLAAVRAQIVNARNGGAWDGTGITTRFAADQPNHATTLGLLSGAEYKSVNGATATFNGFAVADSDVLVKYTWYGDSDFNGVVNFDDYVRTDNGFNNHLDGWLNGDFDLNGTVNFDDYVLIDLAFNTQSGTLGRAVAFLDGSDRSTTGMDDPALQLLEKHFDEFGADFGAHFLSAVPEPGSTMLALGMPALAGMLRRRRSTPHSRTA